MKKAKVDLFSTPVHLFKYENNSILDECKNGLLKMDILGLRNLTVMQDTTTIIKQRHGIDIDLNSLPLDNSATYQLLSI